MDAITPSFKDHRLNTAFLKRPLLYLLLLIPKLGMANDDTIRDSGGLIGILILCLTVLVVVIALRRSKLAPLKLAEKASGGDLPDNENFSNTMSISKASNDIFQAITEQATDGITVADVAGNYLYVNPAFCEMMGYNKAELLTMTVFDVKAPEQDHSSFEKTKTSHEGEPFEVILQRKDGSTFISEVLGKNIMVDGEHRILGAVRDITEQVKSEERTRTLYQAVEQSPISVLIIETDGIIKYVNSAFEATTGYLTNEIVGQNLQILAPDSKQPNQYSHLWEQLSEDIAWEGEILTRKKNGDCFWEYGHFSAVKDLYGKTIHYIAVKEDISLRKDQEEKILKQAHYDTLTGLPNRFLSLDRLSHILVESSRNHEKAALLFLDLDDFKKINDTLGHETGDKLLKEAAQRLSHSVRSGDTIGRLGGDEFIVLLGNLGDGNNARLIAENLIEAFRNAFKIDNRELLLTATIGIAIYPDDGNTPSELLRNADSAMYHAKSMGRNTYSFFTQDMNREVSRRLAIEEQIHGALGRNEFSVYYQPIVETASKKVVGAEALLRWHNPLLGETDPEEFIPIAEQTGIIISMGQFVLVQALNNAAQWQQDFNPDFIISINLSPRQFRDPDLVNLIKDTMESSAIAPGTLELEITEGVLMTGHSYISDAIEALHKLHMKIAMDDFGTGYSSLSYLRNYPFNVLKIDREFVRDITDDSSDRELINAAIAMAHGLKLKVVAEGVETEAQLSYLQEIKCDYSQGFLFGKPVTSDEFQQAYLQDSVATR